MGVNTTLIVRLKAAMEQRGINARELAAQAGVGASFVYDILNGHSRNPTAAKLGKIAAPLGVSASWLVDGNTDADLVAITPLEENAAAALSSTPWRFHRVWMEQQLKLPLDRLRSFEAPDDAMAPALQQGDMALIDIGAAQEAEGIYAVRCGGGILLRKITRLPAGKLRLNPDNPAFAAEEREASADILGRVVWSARKFI